MSDTGLQPLSISAVSSLYPWGRGSAISRSPLGAAGWLHALLALLLLSVPRGSASDAFQAGADMSHLKFFEDRGVVYREAGQAGDSLAILKRNGLNCVRLRLFTSSAAQAAANPYNAINNLDYTLPLAVRVKQAGLRFMLDFHYSDSWADPGKQTKPAAWASLTFDQLERQMREYSSNSIAAFKTAGALPDYVQVGNEIIGGLLWPDGRVGGTFDTPAQWAKLGRLLQASIQGIREAAGAAAPQIIVHLDRGGDWAGTQWFVDRVIQQKVEFDILGESYYPWWHGNLSALRNCLTNAARRYGKPVMVVETAFPRDGSASVEGIPATPEGQVQYVVELAKIVKGIPGGLGTGIVWWGTEYQSLPGTGLAGFDRRSFFGGDGNVLPAAAALGQLAAPVRLDASLRGTDVLVTWPLSGAGMTLTMASSLTPPVGWIPLTDPVQHQDARFRTTEPVEAGRDRFYRLRSPR